MVISDPRVKTGSTNAKAGFLSKKEKIKMIICPKQKEDIQLNMKQHRKMNTSHF